eukprot:TRINITY_DN16674_c0_g1_i1.p1 TRINITY_DN16674_c0_g1~~TRINITY_DN16674_c0_g1_i1.p1  ORF type:complete len:121 (+),score=33.04 TRINITY_DN16674_c0_g1_i1:57-419(+)
MSEEAAEAADNVLDELLEKPVTVQYCPSCSFPAEYCEFSGKLEECKPWLETQLAELTDLREKGKIKKKTEDGEKELPGGKKKKKKEVEVVVSVSKRGGRKHITNIKGMDMFGVSLYLFFF